MTQPDQPNDPELTPGRAQKDRVSAILRDLHGMERRRLDAGKAGDRRLASDLAQMHREVIGAMSTPDLRSALLRLIVATVNPTDMPRCEHCGRLSLPESAPARDAEGGGSGE